MLKGKRGDIGSEPFAAGGAHEQQVKARTQSPRCFDQHRQILFTRETPREDQQTHIRREVEGLA